MATCELDSGSMYGNQPLCHAPATHRVTYRNGSYGPFVALTCRAHFAATRGMAYPGVVESETGKL